jgi:hypothetical protein
MPKLQGNEHVHVHDLSTGRTVVLAPGQQIPDWAVDKIGDPALTDEADSAEPVVFSVGVGQSVPGQFDADAASVPELRAWLTLARVEFAADDRKDALVEKIKAYQHTARAGAIIQAEVAATRPETRTEAPPPKPKGGK